MTDPSPVSKTDRNGDPTVGAILDIIDKENSRYKVAVAVAEYTQQQKLEARQEAIEDVKRQGYGYDDGTGFVLKISFKELAELTSQEEQS